MRIKSVFSNEMPFMIQLPSGEYKIKVQYGTNGEEYEISLALTDKMYRLHLDDHPGKGSYIDGLASELEDYIKKKKLNKYAFMPLKSYITCTLEKDIIITEEQISLIREENVIEKIIKPFLISVGNRDQNIVSGNELDQRAKELYRELSEEEIYELRKDVIIKRELSNLTSTVILYHKALNIFIEQYRDIRDDFFVEPLTIHTLEGTYVESYIDNNLYEKYKRAGKISSVITHSQWRSDISGYELEELKTRLVSNHMIDPSRGLILAARNLLERGEYRSAVLEANAALEISVSDKITEKMKGNGADDQAIDRYLEKTETNFYQRCDYQLKSKTSFSFVQDNPVLWATINSHRKTFRNKVAHTALMPLPNEVEKIINDYEMAVNWVKNL